MASGWHSCGQSRTFATALPQSLSDSLSNPGFKWKEIEWLCFNTETDMICYRHWNWKMVYRS